MSAQKVEQTIDLRRFKSRKRIKISAPANLPKGANIVFQIGTRNIVDS